MEAPKLENCTFDEHDKLGRKDYALFLTEYMKGKCGEGEHYVFNVNSPWGSGKSHFLRCWYNEIKNEHPVVYYDAWENDYSEQPLASLLAVIAEQLKTDAEEYERFIGEISQKLGKFLASKFIDYGAKIISHQVKKHTGIDDEEDESLPEELGDFSKELSGYFKKSLFAQIEKKQSVADSRILMRGLATSCVISKRVTWPVFVMVDELDRCRPSFAVELLENIKHIFNIPGFVFVVATDSGQLQHSIKRVYGEGFDGDGYLGRFFHRRFYLPAPDLHSLLANDSEFDEIISFSSGWYDLPKTKALSKLLVDTFKSFELELREVKEILSSLSAIIYLFRAKSTNLNIPLVVFLICLNKKSPELFYLLKTQRLVNFDGATSAGSICEEFQSKVKRFKFHIFDKDVDSLTFFRISLFGGSSLFSASRVLEESGFDIFRAFLILDKTRHDEKDICLLASYYLSREIDKVPSTIRNRYFELVELSF